MFDGAIENPIALMLFTLALAVCAPAGLLAAWRSREPTSRPAGIAALCGLFVLWGVLGPLIVLNRALDGPMVWLFGREGEDTGVVEFATVALFLWAALTCAWLARGGPLAQRLVFGAGAISGIVIAGEEISWGQWIFQWSTPAAIAAGNLQDETNAHNFLPPQVWEQAYAAGGWALIAAALFMRFVHAARVIDFPPVTVLRDSRFAAPFALSAGVMMQHHLFQELSELALAAAATLAVGWIAASRREHSGGRRFAPA